MKKGEGVGYAFFAPPTISTIVVFDRYYCVYLLRHIEWQVLLYDESWAFIFNVNVKGDHFRMTFVLLSSQLNVLRVSPTFSTNKVNAAFFGL